MNDFFFISFEMHQQNSNKSREKSTQPTDTVAYLVFFRDVCVYGIRMHMIDHARQYLFQLEIIIGLK